MSPGPTTYSYSLGGHHLQVVVFNDGLYTPFDRSYGALRKSASGPPGFTLELTEGPVPEPRPGLRLVYEGPLPFEGDCRFFASETATHLLFPGSCAFESDRQKNWGRIVVAPGNAERLNGAIGVAAIEAAADATGQAMLHAAALSLPDDNRCVLIHAPSGTGKTTTALALFRAGFGLCADDAAFVRAEATGCSVWGFPSDLKVHRHTPALMPWLAPFLTADWNEDGEQSISRDALRAIGRVEDYEPRAVAGIFRLSRTPIDGTTVLPLGRAEMLASLAADNVRTGLTGLLPLQRRRFATLARLVAAVPVYEICAGRDLAGLADAVRSKFVHTAAAE